MLTKTCENGNPIPMPASDGEEITKESVSQEDKNPSPDPELSVALFHDIPVRIARNGQREAMVPIRDIAKALNYDRQSLHDLINRNSELFNEYRRDSVTLSHDDPFRHTCLTRDGVIALIVKLDYLRIKNPAKKQRIIEFQRWAAETLGKVMDGIPPVQPAKLAPVHWTETLKDNLVVADMLARCLGRPKDEIAEVAIRITEESTGKDLSRFADHIFPKVGFVPVKDELTDFLRDCCQFGGKMTRMEFIDTYKFWCQMHRVIPLSRKRVYLRLTERGVTMLDSLKGQRALNGIELNAETRSKMRRL